MKMRHVRRIRVRSAEWTRLWSALVRVALCRLIEDYERKTT